VCYQVIVARLPVRRLIHEEVFAARPAFDPIDGFWLYSYRRTRRAGGETFFDFIALSSSQKFHLFDASVATGLFPTTTTALFTHDLRAQTGLGALCGRHLDLEMLYEYDGSERGAREALRRISRDLTEVAEPWFDARMNATLAHPLVLLGLDWIRAHPEARTERQPDDGSRRAGRWQGNLYDEEVRDELSRVLRRRAFELQLETIVKKQIGMLTNDLLDFAVEVDALV
jgi:hypothetical protein